MASTTVANHMGSPPAKCPRGILKNPSHSSPPTSPNLIDQPIAAKEVTIANTHYNAGNRRTPSVSGPLRHRASSHTPSAAGDLSQLESSQRLKWDEANLYLTEQERTPKMKIDEPKTPFAKGYDPLDDPSDIEDGPGHGGDIPGLELGEPERHVPERRLSDGSSKKAVHVADVGHDTLGMTPEEREKHEKFEKMRKSHYEMRNAVQLLGHTEELLDEEEDDGDNREAGRLPPPMPSIPQQFQGVNGS